MKGPGARPGERDLVLGVRQESGVTESECASDSAMDTPVYNRVAGLHHLEHRYIMTMSRAAMSPNS